MIIILYQFILLILFMLYLFLYFKLIKLTDTYEIQKDGKTYAIVTKEMFAMFREKFEIKTPYGDIKAKINFIDYNFSFRIIGKEISEVSKRFISIRDKYVVDIDNFEDEALLLTCTVFIDMICHYDCEKKLNYKN